MDKNTKNNIFIFFLVLTFLAGIFSILSIHSNNKSSQENEIKSYNEKFDNIQQIVHKNQSYGGGTDQPSNNNNDNNDYNTNNTCPDMLIQNGNFLFLYNSKLPTVNGTNPNPVIFNNLDEYINYHNIQQQNGSNCPLLYVVKENNAQGNDVYRVRPSPFDLQGGLPVEGDNSGTVANTVIISGTNIGTGTTNALDKTSSYTGFDPYNQGNGIYTNLDKIHDSTENQPLSDNPMDPNWGGKEYTRAVVDNGKYDDYNISRPVLFNPKSVVFNPNLVNDIGPPKDIY